METLRVKDAASTSSVYCFATKSPRRNYTATQAATLQLRCDRRFCTGKQNCVQGDTVTIIMNKWCPAMKPVPSISSAFSNVGPPHLLPVEKPPSNAVQLPVPIFSPNSPKQTSPARTMAYAREERQVSGAVAATSRGWRTQCLYHRRAVLVRSGSTALRELLAPEKHIPVGAILPRNHH